MNADHAKSAMGNERGPSGDETSDREPQKSDIRVEVAKAFDDLVDAALVTHAVLETLRHGSGNAGDVTVVVTDDATIQELNATYRNVDAPTDVLSFPARESDAGEGKPAMPPELAAEMDAYLGDLVIAYPYTAHQAQRYGTTVGAELCLLAVHGTLHLLGYDHATPAEQARMIATQQAVLERLGLADVAGRVERWQEE
jgi:probable rRNA maturation factor